MLTYDMKARGRRTKTRHLYACIRQDIAMGALTEGDRLPPKRELAGHLGVSVITVENAYAMLEDEGYIAARPRSGFYVSALQPAGPVPARELERLEEEGLPEDAGEIPGMARIYRRLLSERPEILRQKPPHLGCAVLRNAIAGYLRRYRGMHVQPSHIVIGSGAEYLYGLIVQLFGRQITYGIEDPSYEKIALVYRSNGANIERLKMGRDGISDASLAKTSAQVLHVTPYHSFPSGVTATAARRRAYLAWAEKNGAHLIEDDFDSEFDFFRKPIEPLFSMDRSGRVIYMNTFSKSIAPAIRIAYMVLPEDLLERYHATLGFYSCTVPVMDQYVLAQFIEEGAFERQLRRIRRRLQQPS